MGNVKESRKVASFLKKETKMKILMIQNQVRRLPGLRRLALISRHRINH